MKCKSLGRVLFLFLFTLCFVACIDDKNEPISVRDVENNRISFYYPDTLDYSFELQGGDGNYKVSNNKPEIVQAEITSEYMLKLKPLALGSAVITITDDSDSFLEVDIHIDYYTLNMAILEHKVVITGDLRESEKKEIEVEAIKTISVQIGGGYKFVFTNYREDREGTGKVFLYPKEFGKEGIEGTFQEKRVENPIGEENYNVTVYSLSIEEKTTEFIFGPYQSNRTATARDMIVRTAFIEDVTDMFKENYPYVEGVFTFQLIGNPN